MEKKVLIISYYFPPIGGAGTMRVLKFMKYLPTFNWEPVVLTVKSPYSYMKDYSIEKEIKNNNNIFYTSAFLLGNFFRRFFKYKPKININNKKKVALLKTIFAIFKKIFIFFKNIFYTLFFCPDEYIGWIPFAVIKGMKIIKEKEIDIIFTSGPPNSVHLIGLLLKKITGKKWVIDCRDLWNQYCLNYNPYNIRIKSKIDEYMERAVVVNSDGIIVVSDTMKNQLLERFPYIKNEKFTVITNGYDPSDFENILPFTYKKKFVIIHYGTLFRWRKPDNFFKALKNVIYKHADFRDDILIVFMGIIHENTLKYVDSLGLNSYLEIINYKPYYESLHYLKGANIFLLIPGELSFNENMLTAKLFDYMGAEKPILALTTDGALKDLIEKYSLGIAVYNDNIDEIENAVYKFYLDFKLKKDTYNPKDCSVFERKFITKQLSELLDDVMKNN